MMKWEKDVKDILKLYKKIEQTRYMLAQKFERIPTNFELSEYLGLPFEQINLACMSGKKIMSLDNDNEESRNAYECISTKELDLDTQIIVNDSFTVLNDEERNIIKSRYFEDLTQEEVARKLKMTQVMVSRYEKRSINKMREYLKM